jgi:hypothetical protein
MMQFQKLRRRVEAPDNLDQGRSAGLGYMNKHAGPFGTVRIGLRKSHAITDWHYWEN